MRSVLALGAAFWLVACSPLPLVTAGPDPTDPASPVPPVAHRSVLAGTADHAPVEPKPWADSNRRVMPEERKP